MEGGEGAGSAVAQRMKWMGGARGGAGGGAR